MIVLSRVYVHKWFTVKETCMCCHMASLHNIFVSNK